MTRQPLFRRDRLGPAGHRYSTRWTLRVPGTSLTLRLHHWYGSDDTRAFHSHPQWFRTLVLWGAYQDFRPKVIQVAGGQHTVTDFEVLGPLATRHRPAEYRHYVVPLTRHVWTLLLFGGPRRRWDFYKVATGPGALSGRRYRRDKWFAEHGHHTQDGSPPVRLRPDGSVI